MPNTDVTETFDIGLVGLGTMGSNFALNIADHGFSVAAYNRKDDKIQNLHQIKEKHHNIATTQDFASLCRLLAPPRSIVLLVPAGKPVDAVVDGLVPYLNAGDMIVDSGNSHFTDTDRRSAALENKKILYMGMGMSGGEKGARFGPSLMPGGSLQGYERIHNILKAAAAQVESGVCVDYMGPGSAGHYVKMVHNGIEYALMQLIAETYDLMKRGLEMDAAELQLIFSRWKSGKMQGYLMDITADILARKDTFSSSPLIDKILDQAKQKGTGEWTASEALSLQVPAPTIGTAVMMRHLSAYKEKRLEAAQSLRGPEPVFIREKSVFIDQLENALYCSAILSYAQGMDLLHKASQVYDYQLNLASISRVWSGGCIIRAEVLQMIESAFANSPGLANLILHPKINEEIQSRQADWRSVIRTAAATGLPAPGLMSTLAYWDGYRSSRLPANLTMAQRDYFGAHTYERTDKKGTFHTQWDRNGEDRA